MKGRLILACSIVAVVAGFVTTQSADAQWRTKYVRRDGLFHVEKYHTGNGLTPIGGAVLTTLINASPGIINAATGRDAEDRDAPTRSVDDSWKVRYAEQQQAANNLLARTGALVGYVEDSQTPLVNPGTGGHAQGLPASADVGSNPWKARPQ